MKLSDFKLLTFDTYGTLIDWEAGIFAGLAPLIEAADNPPDRNQALELFSELEALHERQSPSLLYSRLLARVYASIAERWDVSIDPDDAQVFGRSVKAWPAFHDSMNALSYLRDHYFMATLTNCDRISYMGSNARLGIEWDGIYTAQDVGSYKPASRNFDYLLEHARRGFGVFPQQILHVAQSLTHDIVPATKAGLTKVWINRRHNAEGYGATLPPEGPYTIEWEFPSMAAFVDAHKAELAGG